jgi:PEP-CTERM motif
MNRIYGLVTIAGLGMLLSGAAHAATFNAGLVSVTGIGDEIGSGFDILKIAGHAGTFADAGQLGVNIGTGAFIVGGNCNACTLTPTGSVNESFKINGGLAQNFVIDWGWSSGSTTDTLTLALATDTLNFGSYIATLHLSSLVLTGATGETVPFSLTADITPTPLPAALPLFASGLGALGLFGWRRKRKNAAAIAA